MNFINQFFNKSKIKMEKLEILFKLHAHYHDTKDEERLELATLAINSIAESFIGKFAAKPAVKSKTDPAVTNIPDADTQKKETAKNTKKVETVEPVEEEVNESLIEIAPFYVCQVNNGKHEKKISIGSPRKFKVFTTKEAKGMANNAYPTEKEFDEIFDIAWEMALDGKPNKEIVADLRKKIGNYYPELKTDSDWYGKVVNPMVANMNLIRAAFGQKPTDKNVQVSRPLEANLVLTIKEDLFIVEPVIKKKSDETKPVEPIKTIQEGKVGNKSGNDEEQQEKTVEEEEEIVEAEDVETEEGDETADTTEERDVSKPPKVNKFADFNALETLIFEKYREGAVLAEKIKDENGRKAVLAEKRDDSRMLIASAFEDETWTEKIDGRWSPALLSYHNDIVSQISSNRKNWPE